MAGSVLNVSAANLTSARRSFITRAPVAKVHSGGLMVAAAVLSNLFIASATLLSLRTVGIFVRLGPVIRVGQCQPVHAARDTHHDRSKKLMMMAEAISMLAAMIRHSVQQHRAWRLESNLRPQVTWPGAVSLNCQSRQ